MPNLCLVWGWAKGYARMGLGKVAGIREKIVVSETRRTGQFAAWIALAGLLLFAVMAAPFFAGRIYVADDLGAFHLPIRAFYAKQLANGQPYDWMPQLYCGFYLTGEGQAGVYHPLHQILYRFLPLRAALAWEYLLPYPLMMIGTWLWLRRRLRRSDAAMLGGLVFTFSSFNLLHFVHPNAIAVIAHLPWLLWAIDITMVDSRRRRVAGAAALIALLTGSQLLVGYPQFVWFSLLAELSYIVFLKVAERYSSRSGCDQCETCSDCIGCTTQTWPRVLIAMAIGVLIGGIQLLPTFDAWLHSARLPADSQFAAWGSLQPLNVLQLVAPYALVDRVFGGSLHEFAVYAGAVPLVLIAWVLARHRALGRLLPLALAAGGFSLLMLLMAFGRYGLLYSAMSYVPLLKAFRFPCRYLMLAQLGVAVLAAIGFMLLLDESRQARKRDGDWGQLARRYWWAALCRDFEPLWCLVGLSMAVAVAALRLREEPYIASPAAILAGPALIATATALVVLAARGHRLALVGLIVMAALDQGWYGMNNSTYPRTAALDQFIASANTPPDDKDGRVLASLLRFNEPGLRTGDLMTLSGWRRADGYAGLEPRQELDYRLLPALRVAGVRWVKSDASTSKIAGLQARDKRWLEVPDPLPRVRMVTGTRVGMDPACDIAQIRPETTAICELPIALPPSTPGTAVLRDDRPGRLTVDVDCPATQLLVAAESYHSGWQATVDGTPEEVYRVNGDFLGCVVGPGKHKVVLNFSPSSLKRGQITSYFGLAMLGICCAGWMGWPREKKLKEDTP